MAAYSPYVRRTVKWWKTIVFHLLTATLLRNALRLYNTVNNTKIQVKEFIADIVKHLIMIESQPLIIKNLDLDMVQYYTLENMPKE